MTVITGRLIDVAHGGFDSPAAALVFSSLTTRTATSGELVLRELFRLPLKGTQGRFTTPELEPGPVRVQVEGGTVHGEYWDVVVPASPSPVTLSTLVEVQQEWPAPVVGAAQAAAAQALRAQQAATAAASMAEASANTGAEVVGGAQAVLEAKTAAQSAAQNATQQASKAATSATNAAKAAQQAANAVSAGVADATPTLKGKIALAGDLSGTADAPTVPGLAGKAAVSHTHTTAQITGLDQTLTTLRRDMDKKVSSTDARLSDARTPKPHTHTTSDITGLTQAMAGKAAVSHTHTAADISDLNAKLTGMFVEGGTSVKDGKLHFVYE